MFDFLDSDWFNITLEVVFLILISYDVKKYIETKKKEYLTNIVLTIVFAIWTLYPYYNSYVGWEDEQKQVMISHCNSEKNTTLCRCMDEATFKEFTHDEYIGIDKNSSDYIEFLSDAKEDCLDDSWF
jgi:hypothetical protein